MRSRPPVIGLLLFLFSTSAHARVFNYKDATLAAFLRGTGGFSQLNQDAFAGSVGNAEVKDTTNFDYSGELGAVIAMSPVWHLRIGAEVIQHRPVSESKGLDTSGNELFKLTSSVFVFNPQVTFEYVYGAGTSVRYYAAAGFGMANVTVVNTYTMTTAGTSAFGVGNFDEKMESNTYSGHIETGLETVFTDNVTFMTDVGYRYLQVAKMKYKGDATTIQSPTTGVAKGDTVTNPDGSTRTLNLSGLFVGVAFRFYLNFL